MIARILFLPIGILLGTVVARKVGANAFEKGWAGSRGTLPPTATTEQATWPEVVGAAALRGSIIAVTAAAFTRVAASAFRYLFGYWPGQKTTAPAPQLRQRPE
ncbi:MAG: DUF4235 domain-containing protein [Solirubrobacterales bacterium]